MAALPAVDGQEGQPQPDFVQDTGEIGSPAWAEDVRSRVKSLSKQLDTDYMELAKLLYMAWDAKEDKKSAVYTRWGYKTFAAFAEVELGVQHHKAEALRRIWYALEVQLADMDPMIKTRIIALGWTKVREIVRVLTLKNAAQWLKMGEELSYLDLKAAVGKYRSDARAAEIKTAKETESFVDARDMTVPAVEPMFPMSFRLYTDQARNVHEALQRARDLSNSDVRSNLLSLIALDFLATNDFSKDPTMNRITYFARLEAVFGVKLVVVDKHSKEVLYGMSTMMALAEE